MDTLAFLIIVLNNIAWMIFFYYMTPDQTGKKPEFQLRIPGIPPDLPKEDSNIDPLTSPEVSELTDVSLDTVANAMMKEDEESRKDKK
jgi:hypothetical protein